MYACVRVRRILNKCKVIFYRFFRFFLFVLLLLLADSCFRCRCFFRSRSFSSHFFKCVDWIYLRWLPLVCLVAFVAAMPGLFAMFTKFIYCIYSRVLLWYWESVFAVVPVMSVFPIFKAFRSCVSVLSQSRACFGFLFDITSFLQPNKFFFYARACYRFLESCVMLGQVP